MSSNAVAIREGGSSLTISPDQDFFNERQVAALRQLGVGNAGNGDLAVFFHVSQRTGLDPFARQIYMIERQGKQTIQTGIDGYRLIARRAVNSAHEKLSMSAVEWCGPDGHWSDVWLSDDPPSAARIVVYRNGEPFPAIALWREYVQTNRDGAAVAQWKQRPAGQLAKCAEALALRRAFPQDLSGVYVEEELQHSDVVQGQVVQAQGQSGADRMRALVNPPAAADEQAAQDEPPADDDASGEPDPWAPVPITEAQNRNMYRLFNKLGISDRDQQHGFMTDAVGREITSGKDLSRSDAIMVIDQLTQMDKGEPS